MLATQSEVAVLEKLYGVGVGLLQPLKSHMAEKVMLWLYNATPLVPGRLF